MSFFKKAVYVGLVSLLALSYIPLEARDAQKEIAAESQSAKSFISDLCNKALKVLNTPSISQENINREFKGILNSGFDIEYTAKFSFGREGYKSFSESQKKDFLNCFENMLIKLYSKRFLEFKDAQISVTNVLQKTPKDSVITTRIIYGKNNILVNWVVKKINNSFFVRDVLMNNISMKKIQREEVHGLFQKTKNINSFLNEFKRRYATL